jgi:hypothetical protein
MLHNMSLFIFYGMDMWIYRMGVWIYGMGLWIVNNRLILIKWVYLGGTRTEIFGKKRKEKRLEPKG